MSKQFVVIHVSKTRSMIARKCISDGTYQKVCDCNRADAVSLRDTLNDGFGVQEARRENFEEVQASAQRLAARA